MTRTHGGARQGAGRKKAGDGRERMTIRIKAKLAEELRQHAKPGDVIESALEFWQRNQDAARAGCDLQPVPGLESCVGNQDALPLTFLCQFASLGRKWWPDGGDGIYVDGIPLGLSPRAFKAKWGKWVADPDALAEAYNAYGPMAVRVRETLLRANPLLRPEELAGVLSRGTDSVDVGEAIKRLHDYALIHNDHGQSCAARELLAWMRGNDSRVEADDTGYWLSRALEMGRLDVAAAFAGDYAKHGEEAVLEALRSKLKLAEALEWWGRDPAFCRKVDPLIEVLAETPGFRELERATNEIQFMGLFGVTAKDWANLKAFRTAWAPMAAKHGEETLFALFERFTSWKREGLRHRLSIVAPGEADPSDLSLLGLAPGASKADAKAAWRRFVQRHHPDKGGDHARFIRAKAAYERLSGGAA